MTDTPATDRKVFDAACVFGAASVVQFLVPTPLDYFLFPGVVAYLFVQSGQSSQVIDSAYTQSKRFASNIRDIASSFGYFSSTLVDDVKK